MLGKEIRGRPLRALHEGEFTSSANKLDASPDVFERAIIGCLIECQPRHAAKIAGECSPEILGNTANLFAYEVLRNAAFSKTPLGLETAAAAIDQSPGSLEHFSGLDDVRDFLDNCRKACHPFESWPEYVKQVHLAHTRRKLLAAFDEATVSALSASSAEEAMGDAIHKVIDAAGELRRNSLIKETYEISSITDRYLQRYEDGESIAFTYPQDRLNVAGGARKGQVIVIAAETGLGKSWWCLDTVLHAAKNHGKKCRIYTLEMDEGDIVDRMLAMENDINLNDVILQKVDNDDMHDYLADLAELPISIVDSRITPGRVIADIAAMGDHRPDVVVVDHLDLFAWKEGNEVNSLKGALANFKDAAKMYGVTFLLVAQFRRPSNEDEAKNPHIRMLKGGSAIEQIADMVVFITKEWRMDQLGEDIKHYMSVPKIRQALAPTKFRVEFKRFRFR